MITETSFSKESCGAADKVPGRMLACSLQAGWTSLLVRTFEEPTVNEGFETACSPDLLVVLVMRGSYTIESFSDGLWRSADYRPGLGGMTACGRTSRLRWSSLSSKPQESLHIYIPHCLLSATAEEYRRSGVAYRNTTPDALLLDDPVIARLGFTLLEAMQVGAGDLYAQSAAQFMVSHLLSRHSRWPSPSVRARKRGELKDRRLLRVLEYMRAHYADALTLDKLAREAGVSRFYFVQLFKNATGSTPHQYLTGLRMQNAADLLTETTFDVIEVAIACGYQSAAHFGAAFKQRFGCSPSEFRVEPSRPSAG